MKFPADEYRRAHLGCADVSRLYGVTRVTAYNWLKEKGVHPLLRRTVADLTASVTRAVNQGQLPLPKTMRGATRAKQLKTILETQAG